MTYSCDLQKWKNSPPIRMFPCRFIVLEASDDRKRTMNSSFSIYPLRALARLSDVELNELMLKAM